MALERNYRDALAQFPTGIAVVSAMDGNLALAMTINSFASISLEPKIVLWSVDHNSNRYETFRDVKHYSISVLGADQGEIARRCAEEADLAKTNVDWSTGANGAPLITGAVARFECQQFALHRAGDHDMILGEVTGFDLPRKGPALVFHQSMFSQTRLEEV